MDTSSSSDSSDDEIINIVHEMERPRVFRPRPADFELYSDEEFRSRFRLCKQTVVALVATLEEDITPMTERNFPLSPMLQILITLRFYATGGYQILIGDDCGVHKTTVSRVVQKVTSAIANLRPQFVKMPTTVEEQMRIKAGFYGIRGFPNVIGCIDGSHVPILSPGGENAELFRNRNGYFSVNVQAVCDANLMIRNIDARWPGSTHYSTMFNASLLCATLEAGEFDGYLLGDSAYSCKPYLMTPLLNPMTQAEMNYNNSHIATRNTIERTFGVWKRRFGCLSLGLRTKMETTLPIIVATAVLHNIAVMDSDNMDFNDIEVNEEVHQIRNQEEGNVEGNATRIALIQNVFN